MKKPYVRRCWASSQFFTHPLSLGVKLLRDEGLQFHFTQAVFAIPGGVKEFDEMIERAAEAAFKNDIDVRQHGDMPLGGWLPWKKKPEADRERYREKARAVFASAGITRPS